MEGLRQLPDESVHCVVTSPPYFGLRSYLPKDHPQKALEIGSEPTLQEHIAKLVAVFREVRRVLRGDGTLWLNYGDMWASDIKKGRATAEQSGKHAYLGRQVNQCRVPMGGVLKPKDLCMAPHRLAIALQDDGWWVRSDIVWHKPNPMPSSVKDRPTPAKEFIFLLSKSARYFYDAEAIAEPRAGDEDANTFRGGSYVDGKPGPRQVRGNKRLKIPGGWETKPGAHSTGHRKGRTSATYVEHGKNEGSPDRRRSGFNGRWDETEAIGGDGPTRNARDVWTIATEPFAEAHYATFPTALAERCILAGTSEKGCCADCGAPLVRVTMPVGVADEGGSERSVVSARAHMKAQGANGAMATGLTVLRETTGWAAGCSCPAPYNLTPCTVLDPFGGAGTVGLVASRLQRNAILIDIDPANEGLAQARLAKDAPLFAHADGGAS
jgi:site-specific DNA-methyltransferase (cytosine-N4-specific)